MCNVRNSSYQYHHDTSYDRHNMTGHSLDWANQPTAFKDYEGIQPLDLPRAVEFPKRSLSSLMKELAENDGPLDMLALSRILFLTNTLTAKARHPDGDFSYRSAASAGALYPTEIYAASCGIDGLEDGLYHFAINRHGLYPLRQGDFASHILAITQTQEERVPTLTFFLTAILFRSAWKYRARSYRYHLLDTGHVAENLALALRSQNLAVNLSYDFDDLRVGHFLGIDDKREVTLAVAHVFGNEPVPERREAEVPDLSETVREASIVSAKEVDYPAIGATDRAGADSAKGTTPETEMVRNLGVTEEGWSKIEAPTAWPGDMDYPDALFHRRSRRNFVNKPMSKEELTAFLQALCSKGLSVPESVYARSVATGFLVNQVEGMSEGFYVLDPEHEGVGMVARGPFTEKMARVCLDQMWLANAGVHFLFLTNLHVLDRTWGARGYRYAMLTAGRMGQRLYVVATAMGLGCCGIGALYDGEAAALLGLNEASGLLYLVAVGAVKKM
ncbi:MAG TPA: SagB/ThcOx family dehydrogenase [Desulfatiglandales bacterium]|nr:SagB/ThcOx family dehydrogenase [Desulfatiglandales bacterium]